MTLQLTESSGDEGELSSTESVELSGSGLALSQASWFRVPGDPGHGTLVFGTSALAGGTQALGIDPGPVGRMLLVLGTDAGDLRPGLRGLQGGGCWH